MWYYLNLEKSFPIQPCTGTSSKRTAKPANVEGPSSFHNMANTAIASIGPIHRKWRNITAWKINKFIQSNTLLYTYNNNKWNIEEYWWNKMRIFIFRIFHSSETYFQYFHWSPAGQLSSNIQNNKYNSN